MLDLAHGLQTVIEKGQDMHAQSAIGQCDIGRYYDSLPIMLICEELLTGKRV